MNTFLLFIIIIVCSFILILLNIKRKRIPFIITAWLAMLTSSIAYKASMPISILYSVLILLGIGLFITFLRIYIDNKLN